MAYGSVNVPGAMPHKQDALTGLPNQVLRFDGMGLPYAAEGWSNRNLIINWDFRRPVNRNGKTEYVGGYAVDRLFLSNNYSKMVVNNGSISIFPLGLNNGRGVFFATMKTESFAGKTITFSALVDAVNIDNGLTPYIAVFFGDNPHSVSHSIERINIKNPGMQMVSTTVKVPSNYAYMSPALLWMNGITAGAQECKAIAAKLEFGDHQTLARQNEDGEWEIIDPPDYDLQYALCSLYSPSTGERVGSQHSNPNLLDNAYWANRGAIIDQRGQGVYTVAGYTIDRWRNLRAHKIELSDSAMLLYPSEIHPLGLCLYQKLENPTAYTGKILTLSFFLDCPEGVSGNIRCMTSTFTYLADTAFSTGIQVVSLTFTAAQNLDNVAILISSGVSETPVKLYAAKLELGPVQTLARQDADGNWVLNDPPPNKALELAKCQRYWMRTEGHFAGEIFANRLYAFVPTPVTMRAKPAITAEAAGTIYSKDGTSQVPTAFGVNVAAVNGIKVWADMPNNAAGIGVWLDSALVFDANL